MYKNQTRYYKLGGNWHKTTDNCSCLGLFFCKHGSLNGMAFYPSYNKYCAIIGMCKSWIFSVQDYYRTATCAFLLICFLL